MAQANILPSKTSHDFRPGPFSGRWTLGAGLVILGILLLLDQARVADADEVIRHWWPVIIIAIGLRSFAATPSRLGQQSLPWWAWFCLATA